MRGEKRESKRDGLYVCPVRLFIKVEVSFGIVDSQYPQSSSLGKLSASGVCHIQRQTRGFTLGEASI